LGVAVDPTNIIVAGTITDLASPPYPSSFALVRYLGGAATNTTLLSSAASPVSEQEITFTATVTPTGGVGTPTGAVDFIDTTTDADLGSAMLDTNGSASITMAFVEAGTHVIVAHHVGDSSFASNWSSSLSHTVFALTTQNLQAVVNTLPAGGTVTIDPPDTGTLDAALGAVAGLTVTSGSPVGIVLNLSPTTYANIDSTGAYQPIDGTAPANATLTLSCPARGSATLHDLVTSGTVTIEGNITVIGNSPALVVNSGLATIANGVTLVTATDAPTILVNGGTLVVRNSTIEQISTTSLAPAIEVNGGTVDLGTTSSPGGNTISITDQGGLVQNNTTGAITAVGDTFQLNGVTLPPNLSFTALTSTADPSILNQTLTFTATVSAANSASGLPTGSVVFTDQTTGATLGAAALSGGVAELTTAALGVNNHVIMARCSGDSHFTFSLATIAQVVHYKFSGFLPPLNSTLAFGAGRTVPIKFQLTDYNGNYITSLSAVASLQVLNAQGANISTNAGSTTFRYDPTSNQFVANWQTKGLPVGTYTVTLALADGMTYTKTLQLTTSNSASGLTTDETGGTGSAPGGLLGGDIALFVDNSNGDLTADELARIEDAVATVDALVQPYGVAVAEVTDPTQADVTLNLDITSAVGAYADGVLGCTTDAGQVTIIAGWDFCAGGDPTQVGASQYDFETVVMHELGHALGLGHSADPASVMYATLSAGVVNRVMTTADLGVPDSDTGGACGLHAAASPAVTRSAVVPAGSGASIAALGAGRVWMALDNLAAHDIALAHWPSSGAGRAKAKRLPSNGDAAPEPTLLGGTVAVTHGPRREALQAKLVDAVLDGLQRFSVFRG
jgi:hypothetical protein